MFHNHLTIQSREEMADELPPAHGFRATQELLCVRQEKWALGG